MLKLFSIDKFSLHCRTRNWVDKKDAMEVSHKKYIPTRIFALFVYIRVASYFYSAVLHQLFIS